MALKIIDENKFKRILPDGEYPVPGIAPCYRLIIKDNEPIGVRNTDTGKVLRGHSPEFRGKHVFTLKKNEGSGSRNYSVNYLTLAVRSGISFEKLYNTRILVTRCGLPKDYRNYKPEISTFKTVEEIERTLGIVKSTHAGDIKPLFEALQESREKVVKYLFIRYSLNTKKLEVILPAGEERLYNQIMNLNTRSIRPIFAWYAKCVYAEYTETYLSK